MHIPSSFSLPTDCYNVLPLPPLHVTFQDAYGNLTGVTAEQVQSMSAHLKFIMTVRRQEAAKSHTVQYDAVAAFAAGSVKFPSHKQSLKVKNASGRAIDLCAEATPVEVFLQLRTEAQALSLDCKLGACHPWPLPVIKTIVLQPDLEWCKQQGDSDHYWCTASCNDDLEPAVGRIFVLAQGLDAAAAVQDAHSIPTRLQAAACTGNLEITVTHSDTDIEEKLQLTASEVGVHAQLTNTHQVCHSHIV